MMKSGKLTIFASIAQGVFLVLFGLFVEYGEDATANPRKKNSTLSDHGSAVDTNTNSLQKFYPMFQDVHVMMFIGFGFLMTFLKRYGFSAVGFNFLICAFVIQWATLVGGFLHLHDGKINITIKEMLTSDFTCATVLISFGAVLGKTSPLQLLVMSLLEVAAFKGNEYIGTEYFKAFDVGGSMFVHVFGAYFGITVARILYKPSLEDARVSDKENSHYVSDLFSIIGTLFLWMFWPSFNSAVAMTPDGQHRAVLNTYYSLCACTLTTFVLSRTLNNGKFNMVHIQNATLAGGVAVGTTADMMIGAWGAMLIGIVAGALSTCGFQFLQPLLARFKFHDTCGVNNLHGMPGLLAGLGGIVVAFLATKNTYGDSLSVLFPAGDHGDHFSASRQAGMQAAALGTTLAMAIVSGTVTGLILALPIWNSPEDEELFEDKPLWDVPLEGYPNVCIEGARVVGDSGYQPLVENERA